MSTPTNLFDAAEAYREGEISREQLNAGAELFERGELAADENPDGTPLLLWAAVAVAAILVVREVA